MEEDELCHVECLGRMVQWGLERGFKGLLATDNDPIKFRRDAAFLWRHVESVRPITDREGAHAIENLLAATTGTDGTGCSLTGFSDAYRRGTEYPGMSDEELEAVKRWARPAIGALITEALARSETTREDLRQVMRGR